MSSAIISSVWSGSPIKSPVPSSKPHFLRKFIQARLFVSDISGCNLPYNLKLVVSILNKNRSAPASFNALYSSSFFSPMESVTAKSKVLILFIILQSFSIE